MIQSISPAQKKQKISDNTKDTHNKVLIIGKVKDFKHNDNDKSQTEETKGNVIELCDGKFIDKVSTLNEEQLNELELKYQYRIKIIREAKERLMDDKYKCIACMKNNKNVEADKCYQLSQKLSQHGIN